MTRRVAAIASLALGAPTVLFAIAAAVANFPNAIAVLACLTLAVVLGWYGLRRRGLPRVAGLGAAVALLAGAIVLLLVQGDLLANVIVLAGAAVTIGTAATAFAQ